MLYILLISNVNVQTPLLQARLNSVVLKVSSWCVSSQTWDNEQGYRIDYSYLSIFFLFPFFKIFWGRAFMPLLIYSRLTGSRERERWGRETAKIARLQCACWPTQPGLYHMAPMACGVADLTSEPCNLCLMSLPHLSPPFLSVYSILPIKAKKAERISKEKRGKKRSSDRESNRLFYNTSEPM